MLDTTFRDHTRVGMWKLMNSVWNRKWVVWQMNKWSYIFSIIVWTYRTGFLGNLKRSPLLSLCRAYGVTTSVNAVHCQLQQFYTYEIHVCVCNDAHNKMLCYVQHTCKELNFHNGMKTTVTLQSVFFWEFPRRLKFKSRRFGIQCRFHRPGRSGSPRTMEPTLSSETSAFILQTPGKFPKEHRLQEMDCRHWRRYANNGNKTVEKAVWRKSRMEENQRDG